ncbi:MAG: hypothetical protein JXR05_07520 [Flavobacteriaceae bacterium]
MNIEDDILIERFLNGQLSEEEQNSFLERMKNDVEFKEQVTLEKQLVESLNDDSWSFLEEDNNAEVKEYEAILRSKEVQEIKQSIAQAQDIYKQTETPKKKNWIGYAIAASVTILVAITIFSNKKKSPQELYASFLQKTDLLALIDRGSSTSLSSAQESFDNKEYEETIRLLSEVTDSIRNGNVYLYLAISQMELKEYSNAESTLGQLINSNLLDAQKGHWFKSLLYLKSNQTEKLKAELKIIISNSYYKKDDAKELLSKIE